MRNVFGSHPFGGAYFGKGPSSLAVLVQMVVRAVAVYMQKARGVGTWLRERSGIGAYIDKSNGIGRG